VCLTQLLSGDLLGFELQLIWNIAQSHTKYLQVYFNFKPISKTYMYYTTNSVKTNQEFNHAIEKLMTVSEKQLEISEIADNNDTSLHSGMRTNS